jgi:hypothetical protein
MAGIFVEYGSSDSFGVLHLLHVTFKTNPTATNRHKSRIGSECPVAGSNVLPVVDSECPVAGSNVPVIDSTSGAHPEVIRREGSASRFIRRKRLTGVSSPFKVPGTAPRVAHPP